MNAELASDGSGRRRPRLWLAVIALIVLLAIGTGAGWAVATVLRPAEDPLDARSYTYVSVEPGEVGSSLSLNAVAEWTSVPVGANMRSGIVTGVSSNAGDEVSQGSVLYSVDLRPVVIAQGEVPAFRAIGEGVEGGDVAQLQSMLIALAHYAGPADGKVGPGTVTAIKRWQKALGLPQTGTVELGDVIFVPTLPTRISLETETIARGKSVSPGIEVVRALPSSPTFTVPATEQQAALMPAGTRVEITSPEGVLWEAFATDQKRDEETGTVIVSLSGADGGVICADQCAQVPVTGDVLLGSRIVTVETVEGLVVPSAALTTDASGATFVIDENGARLPVTVDASARGMSVITGVDQGMRVRVPAQAGASDGDG